jgi:hypothetical protein
LAFADSKLQLKAEYFCLKNKVSFQGEQMPWTRIQQPLEARPEADAEAEADPAPNSPSLS